MDSFPSQKRTFVNQNHGILGRSVIVTFLLIPRSVNATEVLCEKNNTNLKIICRKTNLMHISWTFSLHFNCPFVGLHLDWFQVYLTAVRGSQCQGKNNAVHKRERERVNDSRLHLGKEKSESERDYGRCREIEGRSCILYRQDDRRGKLKYEQRTIPIHLYSNSLLKRIWLR